MLRVGMLSLEGVSLARVLGFLLLPVLVLDFDWCGLACFSVSFWGIWFFGMLPLE